MLWAVGSIGFTTSINPFAPLYVRYFRPKTAHFPTNALPFQQKYFIIERLGTNSFQIFVVCLARNFMPCYALARFYCAKPLQNKDLNA